MKKFIIQFPNNDWLTITHDAESQEACEQWLWANYPGEEYYLTEREV